MFLCETIHSSGTSSTNLNWKVEKKTSFQFIFSWLTIQISEFYISDEVHYLEYFYRSISILTVRKRPKCEKATISWEISRYKTISFVRTRNIFCKHFVTNFIPEEMEKMVLRYIYIIYVKHIKSLNRKKILKLSFAVRILGSLCKIVVKCVVYQN